MVDAETALAILLSPDGYYTYLEVKSSDHQDNTQTFNDTVKKNYRKLCLRHHPDKPGGSATTFQALNRAYKVLTNPNLRKQYDMIGLDLDDEDDHQDDHDDGDNSSINKKKDDEDNSSDHKSNDDDDEGYHPGAANSAISQIATATIGGFMKLGVQTVLMGFVSAVLSRFRILLYPSVIFLLYGIFKFFRAEVGRTAFNGSLILISIGVGVSLMHAAGHDEWNRLFWLGESVVLGFFMYNAITPKQNTGKIAIIIFAPIATYIIGGSVWRYGTIVLCEAIVSLILIVTFPMMEMILEEIINDKLRKVGEKIRAHALRVDQLKSCKEQ